MTVVKIYNQRICNQITNIHIKCVTIDQNSNQHHDNISITLITTSGNMKERRKNSLRHSVHQTNYDTFRRVK